MSYDLHIYTVLKPKLHEYGLAASGEAFVHETATWQIVFHNPDELEVEDVPQALSATLPGIQYGVSVNIEGPAPSSAISKAKKLAENIAKSARGLVIDEQTDEIFTPSGVKRLPPLGPDTSIQENQDVSISWYFVPCPLFAERLDRLTALFETHFPEALPRRYGECEPPQHRMTETGRGHFINFLRDNLSSSIVWYPHPPFTHVDISVPECAPSSLEKFRAGLISLSVSASALKIPGWQLQLQRFWLDVARHLNPFYAEVRSDEPRIPSWWWNGIPDQKDVLASGIGPPYLDLWQRFADGSTPLPDSQFHYQLSPSIAPPSVIAQPPSQRIERDSITGEMLSVHKYTDIQYPPSWPFDSLISYGNEAHLRFLALSKS